MKKVPGVSYLELFVSMTIFAMLSVLAMPNFIGWQERETFKSQSEEIFQMINVARVNALTERTCYVPATGQSFPTEGWALILEHDQMTLRCYRDREWDFFSDTVIEYDAGIMINEFGLHYYSNHNYNCVFYTDEDSCATATPNDLHRVDELGVRALTYSQNPSSLLIDFLPGTAECNLGASPEIRGMLLPMYLAGDSAGLKRFICLDRMAGLPYFCSDQYPTNIIQNMGLTE